MSLGRLPCNLSRAAAAGTLALLATACGAGGGNKPRASAVHEFGTSGSVVIAANSSILAPITPFRQFGIARYTPDGRLDRSFGSNGATATDLHANRYGAGASAVALQVDQKIVAFGQSTHTLGQDPHECAGGGDPAIVRYLPNGRLDPSFGSGGVVMTKIPEFSEGLIAGAIEPSGKIVAVGSTYCYTSQLELLGYMPDGRVDQTFGKGGKGANTRFAFAPAADVAIQSDGKIVLAGSQPTSTEPGAVSALVRYLPNGHLDTRFGKHGIVLHGGGGLSALAIQPDGKILAVGSIDNSIDGEWAAVRYDPDGHLDPSFGTRGKVGTPFKQLYYDSPGAVDVQGDGKILVGGGHLVSLEDNAPRVLALVRYMSDGHVDTSFGDGGKIVDRSRGAVVGIAIEPGGRIIVLASRTPSQKTYPPSLALLAYTANGRPDLGFGK